MKIAVLLKIVPDTETRFQIQPDGTDVVWDSSIEWIIGPYDEYAVEEAIKIKEAHGGEVIAVTIGRGNEEKSIRKAMAMGVDEAILIVNPELADSDSATLARAYSELVKPLEADIILTGKLATDTSDASLGPAVAQVLNYPVISEIENLEVADGAVVAVRSAAGRKERFEAKIPVVLTADKGLNEPRYPKLPDIMKAKKKPLHKDRTVSIAASPVNQVKAEFPPEKAGGSKIEGTPEELVDALIEGLVKKDKVL